MFQDLTTLVVDVGTFSAKIGYGGDEAPKIVCPSYVGIPNAMDGDREFYAGTKYLNLDKTDLQI